MSEEPAPSAIRHIHIDTDPGLDDLLAMAIALASPELRVEGITTVAGNAPIEVVTENARRFLALAGLDIPLGRGAGGPLSLSRVDAVGFHGGDGRRGVPIPAIDGRATPSAASVLERSLRERHVDTVVALGPLTNLAALWRTDPDVLRDVELVWMGGTLGPGNVTAVAEFNAFADPAAASLLLGSDVPMRVVGLDVTRLVTLRPREVPDATFGPGPMGTFLRRILEAQMEAEIPVLGERLAVLHDPCAVLAICDRDLLRYEEKVLEVAIEEGHERGRLSELPVSVGRSVRFAVEAHEGALKDLFVRRLTRWTRGESA